MTHETLDPEIAADMRLRADTERHRDPKPAKYSWTSPAIVEHWPCRMCGVAMVGVTAEAAAARDHANQILVSRREPEIAKSQIVFCDRCTPVAKAQREERHRKAREETAAVIRELRSLVDNDLRERVLVDRLRELGQPDIAHVLADARAHRRAAAAARAVARKRAL
jgi:hypothetical protein